MTRFKVVICGGGIAGIEGLLRLRRLAGDHVDITMLSPATHLHYLPLTVLEPFGLGQATRYPLQPILDDAGASWIPSALAWVDRNARLVHSAAGEAVPYDALLLAVGGERRPASPHMDVFPDSFNDRPYGLLLDAIDAETLTDLAFAVPQGAAWPLPLYELALLTAHHAATVGKHVRITLITPDPRPLHVFGDKASGLVTGLLADAGVERFCESTVRMPENQHVVLHPSGIELRPQRTVTLPRISGPNIRGIPGEASSRFLALDAHCRVLHTDGRVFAAGDATKFPIKHGGLGAQQADTAAAGIAHLAGLGPASRPLRPVIRGTLMTGSGPFYLSAHVIAGRGLHTEIYRVPPWPQDDKIVAEELGPYLSSMKVEDGPEPSPHRDLRP
jgi:sulfide:quinone oxidoreductase